MKSGIDLDELNDIVSEAQFEKFKPFIVSFLPAFLG